MTAHQLRATILPRPPAAFSHASGEFPDGFTWSPRWQSADIPALSAAPLGMRDESSLSMSSVQMLSMNCPQIAMEIMNLTTQYHQKESELDDLLVTALEAGIVLNAATGQYFDPTGALAALVVQLEMWAAEIFDLKVQLTILASMYSAYGCWDQENWPPGSGYYDPPLPDAVDQPVEDNCYTAYAQLLITRDNGQTWELGPVTICG